MFSSTTSTSNRRGMPNDDEELPILRTKVDIKKRREERLAREIPQKIKNLEDIINRYNKKYVQCSRQDFQANIQKLQGRLTLEQAFNRNIKPKLKEISQIFDRYLQMEIEGTTPEKIIDQAREAFYKIGLVYKAFGFQEEANGYFKRSSNFEHFHTFIDNRIASDDLSSKIETIFKNLDLVIPDAENKECILEILSSAYLKYTVEADYIIKNPEETVEKEKILKLYANLDRLAAIYEKLGPTFNTEKEEINDLSEQLFSLLPEAMQERYITNLIEIG